jgi:cytochrome b involved in lipid metabolism
MDLSKELKIGVALMVFFFVIVGILMSSKDQTTTQINTPVVPIPNKTLVGVTPMTTSTSYSLAEVAKHSSQSDCWLIINNNVYNATDYLFTHPGGASAITPYCGADATAAYTGMTKHGGRAAADLATLLIGSLK